MTTITIKETINLEKREFGTVDEFIEDYLASRNKVVLLETNESDLSKDVIDDLAESRKLGLEDLHDFNG